MAFDPEADVYDDSDDEAIVTAGNRIGRKVPDIVIRGMHEREILAQAPAQLCDRVHWTSLDEFDVHDLLPTLSMPAYTRRWSDGQYRVWVPEGLGHQAREEIKHWCEARELDVVNIRVEPGVPFRDLESVPGTLIPELIAACVDWLYPRTSAIRRRLEAELDLVSHDDVRSMMYLFVHDHADRYDADREGKNGTLNFIAFMFGKIRTWPQDAARAAYGRTAVNDRVVLNRIADDVSAQTGRLPSEAQRADALGISVTDLRRREKSVTALSAIRNYRSLDDEGPDGQGGYTQTLADDVDVAETGIETGLDAALTRALVTAANGPDAKGRHSPDPLALAAIYLTYWEGMSRADVARELEVLPKTATAAINRITERIDPAEFR